jgi:S-adenosylmethionine:tRNA-ribosyltransferase-isomerase (queuine synthetase)
MLLLDRVTDDRPGIQLQDLRFSDLTRIVSPGDLLVVNESRVLPVRL